MIFLATSLVFKTNAFDILSGLTFNSFATMFKVFGFAIPHGFTLKNDILYKNILFF